MKKLWFFVSVLILSACSEEAPVPEALSTEASQSQKMESSPSEKIALPEGVTLIESKLESRDEPHIPYAKYKLNNGLTVVLSPDHSDPLVHVDVTYHVGSAREEVGRSGFAHFFEHMMFQGSEHVPTQEHFRIVSEAGGDLNGTTNSDRTNYFETVPSNQLEKMLWLESDRMGFLLNAVSQEKFEIQRDTVKNERGQNYDNRPYGLIYERIGEALYPEGHPYSWQTIGYVSDLDRVDVNDLKAFFLRWYGPNNAVLTIGGDIDQAQTLQWINKYFGSILMGPEVVNAPKQPAKLDKDRFITLEDRIRQPVLMLAFPTEYAGAKSQAALDSLAEVLTSGVFYKDMVKEGKALEVEAYHDCDELSCVFYIYAMGDTADAEDLTFIYQDVMAAIQKVKDNGIEEDELKAVIGQVEASSVYAVQSVSGKVSQLAYNQTFFDKPDRLQESLEKFQQLTTQDLTQALEQFIYQKPKVILSVVPKKKTNLAVQDANFTPPTRVIPENPHIDDSKLLVRETKDNFDRSIMPPATGPVSVTIPELYRFKLNNGVPVLATMSKETPTVTLNIDFPAGDLYDPKNKEGLAKLTAYMLTESTQKHTKDELERKLNTLGSSVTISQEDDVIKVLISSLAHNLDATMELANERMFEPAFNEADFERIKNQAIQELIYAQQTPNWMTQRAKMNVLFKDTILARDSAGTEQSLESITLDEVKAFYQSHFIASASKVFAVGDADQEKLETALSELGKRKGEAPKNFIIEEIKPLEAQQIYFVDKPNAPQSVVNLVRLASPYDATGEMFLTRLANFNLSGNFNSRINLNLREEKGYTYGAWGRIIGSKTYGYINFSAQVRADSTGVSVQEFIKEMDQYYQQGMTKTELEFMKLAIGQQEALNYETPLQKIRLLTHLDYFDLSDDFMHDQAEIVKAVELDELNQKANKWFNPKDYQIIVVGDAETVLPQLKTLNIPIKQIELVD